MKKHLVSIILFAVLMVCCSSITAQTQDSDDSLSPNLDVLIKTTDHLKTSDSNQFKQNLVQLQHYFGAASNSQKEFINYLQAYDKILDGDLEAAQAGLKQLFEKATSLHIKIRIKATLANIQAISREYVKSLMNLDFAINNVEAIGDQHLTNKINLISSIVYFLLEIYDMSSKYAELVVNANPDAVMLCKASVYSFRSRLKLNSFIDEQQMHDTLELCYENNEIIYASLLKLDWIHKELEQAHTEEDQELIPVLLKMVQTTENEVDEFGYNNLIGLKDMVLAKAYYYDGQVELALESANKSIDGSLRSGNTSQVVDALKILQQEALKHEAYESAYQLGKRINLVESEIYSEAKSKQMAYMSVKHNNLAKQVEIQQLKQNNQLLVLENKLSEETTKRQQLMMLLIASLLLLLGVWSYKIKKRHDYFKEVAEIDHLTQVFTRKAFEEKVKVMLDTCEARNESVNLAIMDLDHFKNVNDQYGHLVGDWVLKQVILTCENVADQDILVARLGGEEFSIVSPGITQLEMMHLMEKMRDAIEVMDCSESGADFNITASFGVTDTLHSGYRISMLLTHADLALFEAKNKGRNEVVAFQEIMEEVNAPKV